MPLNPLDLRSELDNAYLQLKNVQLRVVELETLLELEQPKLVNPIQVHQTYQLIFDNLIEGCQIIGFDWRYLYINSVAAQHGGMTKEQLLGYTMMEKYPGIEDTSMFAALRRCMEERISQQMENEFTCPDGTVGWFELRIQPVPEGLFVLSLDITDRKRAEEQLRLQNYALEHSINGYDIVNEDGLFVYANQAYLQMWGYDSLDEVIGTSPVSHCADPTMPQQIIAALHEHGECVMEFTARRKDGSFFEVQMASAMTRLPDGRKLYMSSSLDITDRELAAKELRALYNATSYLQKADSMETLGQQIVEAVVSEFNQVDCGLIMVDEEQNRLIRHARRGKAKIHPKVSLRLDGPGLVPLALRTSRIICVPDVTQEAAYVSSDKGTKSELVIPLKINERVIGALDLQSPQLDAFSERDQRILTAYAERAAATIENMQLYEAINRHAIELEWRVTERTAELQIAKEQIEAIFNNSLDSIVLTSLDFQLQRCNTQAYTLFNIDRHTDIQAVSLLDFIADTDHERLKAAAQKIIRDGTGITLEIRICRHHNTWFDAELSMGHIKDDGLVCSIRDVTDRKQTHTTLQAKLQEEIAFQNYQKALHQLTIELTQVDQLDHFYKQAVNLGRERLGFDRMALFLYNATDDTVTGTYGTDVRGNFVAEHHVHFKPTPNGMMRRALNHVERFAYDEQVPLFTANQQTGVGWNAAAVLWNGHDILGWLTVDNGLQHKPASKPQLEVLALYASMLGTLLSRKKAEVQLRESEARYRLLADNISDMVIRLDPEGNFLYVSASSRTVLGYEPEEMIGKNNFDYVIPEDRAHVIGVVSDAALHPTESRLVRSRCVHKSGQIVWIETIGRAILSGETGEVEGFIAAARNVTAQKQAEEALQESEARYRLLAENITDMIVRVTSQGVYRYVSPSVKLILGYEPNEIVGKSILDFIHPDDMLTVFSAREETFDQGIEIPLTYRVRHRDGHYIWIEVVRQVIGSENEDTVHEFVASARNVTDRVQAEQALRQNERLLRLILDSLPVGVWMFDAQGNITLVNPVGQQLWVGAKYVGIEKFGEYKAWWLESGKRLEPHDWAATRAIVRGETSLNEELEIEAFDGTRKVILNSGIPIWDEQGNILGAIAVNQEITERKQAELAIRESEAKFRQLLDAAPIATIITDDKGRMILVNLQAETLFGYERMELIGQPVEMLVPPDARDRHMSDRTGFAASPHMRQMGSGMEIYAQRKDGSQVSVEIQLSHIETNTGTLIMCFVVDVTERNRVAVELQRQRTFLQQVIDVSPSMIFVKDYNARFVLANPMVAQMYGTTPDVLIGKSDADFNASLTEVEAFLEADRHVIDSGERLFIEEPLTTSTGEIRWLQTTKVPIASTDGKSKHVLGVSTDITERRKSEEALRQAFEKERELGELKSRFVSMASHEFRTPLATILVLTETLLAYRAKLTDEQITQRLEKIQEQVDHLSDIMEDVLLLARMQTRRVKFEPVRLNLDSLCRSVMDEFQSQSGADHHWQYICDERLYEVTLDKKLMRQIISNLLSNAVKYSLAETTIKVNLLYENEQLILKVQDEGIGIPEADLKHLFEPFHRAANVGTISGTGLGMVIAKESVELHAGTISVDSHVGTGTIFTVSIPLNGEGEHGDDESLSD